MAMIMMVMTAVMTAVMTTMVVAVVMVVMVMVKLGGWAWIYCLLYSEGPEGPITANNYPIR